MKGFLTEAQQEWRQDNQKLESKMDVLIQLEKDRLALEREKLEFKKLLLAEKNKNVTGSGGQLII